MFVLTTFKTQFILKLIRLHIMLNNQIHKNANETQI